MNALWLSTLLLLVGSPILCVGSAENDTYTWCHDHDHHHNKTEHNETKHDHPHSVDFLKDLFRRYMDDEHNETCTIGKHGMEHLLKDMGIANGTDHAHEHEEEHNDDEEDHHDDHRRRRSVGHVQAAQGLLRRQSLESGAAHLLRHRRSADDHDHNHTEGHDVAHTCYDQHQLMEFHHLNDSVGVTRDNFTHLCPSLVQQLTSRACWKKEHGSQRDDALTQAQKFGYGTLSVLIISLLALPGILVVKWRHSTAYPYIISAMLGLAVGTLFGDATLHLIPQGLGLHVHGDDGHDHDHDHNHGGSGGIHVEPFVWKMLALNAATYGFLVLQTVLSIWADMKKKKMVENSDASVMNGSVTGIYRNPSIHVLEKGQENAAFEKSNGDVRTVSEEKTTPQLETQGIKDSDKESGYADSSLGLMVTIGDGIHNFADGLAIGASFAAGWKSGLATSIAVACHELPHELGDIAAMLSIGWSARRVALLNLLAACTAFLGLYIGIPVSQNVEARQWIFIITAGMFLYIALADLLPELQEIMKDNNIVKVSLAAGCGILVGLTAMLLIAIFEDKIKIN